MSGFLALQLKRILTYTLPSALRCPARGVIAELLPGAWTVSFPCALIGKFPIASFLCDELAVYGPRRQTSPTDHSAGGQGAVSLP